MAYPVLQVARKHGLRRASVRDFHSLRVALLADHEWLDEATKPIGQFWKRKNAKHNGLTTETQAASMDMLA
jgi:hypothetical protein